MGIIKRNYKKKILMLAYMLLVYLTLQQQLPDSDYAGIARILIFCIVSIVYYFINSKLKDD